MKLISLSLFLFFAFGAVGYAQKYGLEKADSLKLILQKEKTDTGRVKLMADISEIINCFDNKLGLAYAEKALNLSNKIGYKKGIGLAHYAAGVNYIFRGDFPNAIDNLTAARNILEKEDDIKMRARCYMQIGGAHLFVVHADTALAYAIKAVELFTQIRDNSGLAECYHVIGLVHLNINNNDTALKYFDKGLELSRQTGREDLIGLLLVDLGCNYYAQNNYIKALSCSFDAMTLLEKIHGGFLSCPIGIICSIYLQTKDYGKAKAYAQKAAEVAEKQNDKFRTANSFDLLGEICNKEKDYSGALKNYSRSFELFRSINNPPAISYCYGNIGNTYQLLGDYTHALDYLFVALKMTEELNDKFGGNYWLYVIGNVYLELAKNKSNLLPVHPKIPPDKKMLLQSADDYFIKAKAMALEVEDIDDLALIFKSISELKKLQGNDAAALDAYKESVKYNDSLNSISKRNDFTGNELEYEYSKLQDSMKLVDNQKEAINKSRFALQQKATEEERRTKKIAGAAVIILLLLSTFIYYIFLQRRKLSNQLATSLVTLKDTQAQLIHIEKEKEGEKVRQGISRDLHDNLGSTLSGIAMYSHMMDNQIKSGNLENIKASVNVIQKSANEVVGKLSDLVWSANSGQDSLQQLLERLKQYGMEMCNAKNIEFNMHSDASGTAFYLPPEHRYYIYLVAKEAINNAVKYSNASLLELKVKEIAGMLEIAISDNGAGFIMDDIKKGNGLDNMEKRMEEIGAAYNLYAKPGEGCKVSIQLKIT